MFCTAITNGSWEETWMNTTRFIVDSYHYINHRTSDYLCRKWCNPAPLDGSAPNLVVVEKDKEENNHYKCAFNTQITDIYLCLANLLTYILGMWTTQCMVRRIENILKRMNPWNFDWVLHTMLFYHTRDIIERQNSKASNKANDWSI